MDLYFLLKNHFTFDEIGTRAAEIFGELFSAKLFRAQLSYFDDVDYTEAVEYLIPAPADAEIKDLLVSLSTEL